MSARPVPAMRGRPPDAGVPGGAETNCVAQQGHRTARRAVNNDPVAHLFWSGGEGEFEVGEVAGAGAVEWLVVPPGV